MQMSRECWVSSFLPSQVSYIELNYSKLAIASCISKYLIVMVFANPVFSYITANTYIAT